MRSYLKCFEAHSLLDRSDDVNQPHKNFTFVRSMNKDYFSDCYDKFFFYIDFKRLDNKLQ